ncbi:uncharacterized protein PV07_08953 [Cladophialophora immunda]|uniref:EthD domain-containing protein n=1 Tax=Cladophialophora immunda TaxID=569365 RepID=A0A0D2C5P5_9EURO|nr:uncharacterized protein PV07_08953 [Cladophialophora immunda]KIW25810.1 hypothetical protein PV07_08953 [Cladophialophora immunda]OQU96192.1 hypothetical protein CLAIMM_02305 [Cladophialophora immunda]
MTDKIACVVAYPSTTKDGKPARFDMDYYLKTHMGEIINRDWKPFGMGKWTVASYGPEDSLDGKRPPYMVTATIEWDKIEDLKEALAKGSEVSGKDVANYTDVYPEIWISKITGTSSS